MQAGVFAVQPITALPAIALSLPLLVKMKILFKTWVLVGKIKGCFEKNTCHESCPSHLHLQAVDCRYDGSQHVDTATCWTEILASIRRQFSVLTTNQKTSVSLDQRRIRVSVMQHLLQTKLLGEIVGGSNFSWRQSNLVNGLIFPQLLPKNPPNLMKTNPACHIPPWDLQRRDKI